MNWLLILSAVTGDKIRIVGESLMYMPMYIVVTVG